MSEDVQSAKGVEQTEPCANCGAPVVTTVGMDTHVVVRYNGVTEYVEEYYCNESCLSEEVSDPT